MCKNIIRALQFHKQSRTKTIVFHHSASLKFNPNCGFTQYNEPNTNRSTVILVWSELQSTLFALLRNLSLYLIKHLPEKYFLLLLLLFLLLLNKTYRALYSQINVL